MTDSWTGWFSPAVALVFLDIALLLVVVIWSIKRHRSPKLKIECSASIKDLRPSLTGLTLGKRGSIHRGARSLELGGLRRWFSCKYLDICCKNRLAAHPNSSAAHPRELIRASLGTVVAGNSVEVLENGAFFDVLIERIAAAEKSVHFETFLWKEGVLGQRVAAPAQPRGARGKHAVPALP